MTAKKIKPEPYVITPQPKQAEALTHPASIVVYGGAAGSGKTFTALLLPLLLGGSNPKMRAILFRRELPQIKNPGGVWDESWNIYGKIPGAIPNKTEHKWTLPAGGTLTMAGMQHEHDRFNYQGAQLDIIIFDEATHFTEEQIVYMLSRARGTSGIEPKVLITCNPDPDSFVAKLIEWYLDPDGNPLKDRVGKTRHFARQNGEWKWADTSEEIISCPGWEESEPKSFTFVAANIQDNQILLTNNPAYLSNLKAQSTVERARLLDGNWKVRAAAGKVFNRAWFTIQKTAPAESLFDKVVRGWDMAASQDSGDYTTGVLLGKIGSLYYVLDVVRGQWSPGARNKVILQTAQIDEQKYPTTGVSNWFEQEPGSGGKAQVDDLRRLLDGFNVRSEPSSASKTVRADPMSCQCEAGNVIIIEGDWNDVYLNELHGFPDGKYDDQVDGGSLAYNKIAKSTRVLF